MDLKLSAGAKKWKPFEISCFPTMGKIKWSEYISNEKVLSKLKTKRTSLQDIQKQKLSYFRHIERKNVEGKMKGRLP